MDKLVMLVGKSGSGKSAIAELLGYNVVDSYTNRKPRFEGEKGHTFLNEICITDNGDVYELDDEGFPTATFRRRDMIAFEEVYEGIYYFATREQIEGKGTSIYIIDPKGTKEVIRTLKGMTIITIYLETKSHTRACRMMGQGRSYSESLGRLQKDSEIFKVIKCDYVVDANRGIVEVVNDVRAIIEQM